jgi:hypothetical protein
MGQFKLCCSRVLNGNLPIKARFNLFIGCCSAFGGLANARMQTVYDHLGRQCGFDRVAKPTGEQMIEATGLMIAARFRLLHERRSFQLRRRKEKRAGRRQSGAKLYDGLDPLALLNRRPPRRPESSVPDKPTR